MDWKSNRRLLLIGEPGYLAKESLGRHEISHAKNLEAAFPTVTELRPDLVLYFAKNDSPNLEEHVLTWLVEGFHGKVLLFDPMNRVKDSTVLLQSQVIDDYFSGPIGRERLLTIVRNQLAQHGHFAPPRAMTTFDLFRNLFERGLNAIFFFDRDLERCVACNLQAERITGLSLAELRRSSLRELCSERDFASTLRTIRRAGRHYYDSRGVATLKNAEGRPFKVSFSCGVFAFGRRHFVKMEVQAPAPAAERARPARIEARYSHHSHA